MPQHKFCIIYLVIRYIGSFYTNFSYYWQIRIYTDTVSLDIFLHTHTHIWNYHLSQLTLFVLCPDFKIDSFKNSQNIAEVQKRSYAKMINKRQRSTVSWFDRDNHINLYLSELEKNLIMFFLRIIKITQVNKTIKIYMIKKINNIIKGID